MSLNSFGHVFRVTTWGESHGPALGAVVDGCPPGVALDEDWIQPFMDRRRPGTSKNTTQRQEADRVRIMSGVFEGRTTGTPIMLMIENTDQRSKDYGEIAKAFRPGHADITYHQKYGLRDYRGGGRSSARETAARVAAGAVAQAVLRDLAPSVAVIGYMVQMGEMHLNRANFDEAAIRENAFFLPDAGAAQSWEDYLTGIRKAQNSVGAAVEVLVRGCPPGLGAPVYGKLDTDLAAAMMSINAVKGVEIGEGMAAAALTGVDNADEIRMGPDGPVYQSNHAGGNPWRDLERAGYRGAVFGEADQFHSDPAPHHYPDGRGDRADHQGPPRSLRRHPRRAGGRGHGRLRGAGPPASGPRPDRRHRGRIG